MPHGEITGYIDVPQVALYVFWAFFFGLVFWLRGEDRREGYPLESDPSGKVKDRGFLLIPKPKTYLLRDGGSVATPAFQRDIRPVAAQRAVVACLGFRQNGDEARAVGGGKLP